MTKKPCYVTRDKIKGMLIGGAIGDALGGPVETWGPEKITEVHGGPIARYVAPIGHRWFKPEEFFPGMTTDDTQLTAATMRGMITGHELADCTRDFDYYMDAIAEEHVKAMNEAVGGWGKSTTEAVRRLANGVKWTQSGKTTEPKRGTGNGVPMKVAPLAAWALSPVGEEMCGVDVHLNQRLVDFSAMTHYSKISAEATVIHANVLIELLGDDGSHDFTPEYVSDDLFGDVWQFRDEPEKCGCLAWQTSALEESEHSFKGRTDEVTRCVKDKSLWRMGVPEIAEKFGGGSCYVNDSLPFSYALFLREWQSFNTILSAVNAGGDNDTNAKFVGEMLGALHGLSFFQQPHLQWALDGLLDYHKLVDLADEFCDTFKIPETSKE